MYWAGSWASTAVAEFFLLLLSTLLNLHPLLLLDLNLSLLLHTLSKLDL